MLVAAPAQAQGLALDGVWGNEAGCELDGDYAADEKRVLTADAIDSYGMGCEWLQALAAADGAQIATGLCGHEGEEYRTVETFIIERVFSNGGSEAQRLRIRTNTGEVWGEVSKCP